ncbi:MAG: DNA helicase RecQ [Tractidigestivibacter sp.]|jgi:ATP-dependent DNA helicase RecQ|uniref:DNA helicase RecQ n=1 Tax=Tractidigestivibacter sp. TaxID=2847320 RepID=UPI003D90BC58
MGPTGHTSKSPAEVLKGTFGFDSFRPHQEEIIDAVLAGRDALAVMPTSAGKSICYQVPAIVLGGLTIVVSPLISLMADQVASLRQAGVSAAYLNSSLRSNERDSVLEGIGDGAFTLVYVAPERLDDQRFLETINRCGVSLVAVDEAHCVSQWGHDFRPSYQRIRGFLEGLPERPPTMALTATATPQVKKDIAVSLGLRDPLVVVASFDRPNLSFSVARPRGRAGKNAQLVSFLRAHGQQSGIVYCSSRRDVEDVRDLLNAEGLSATRYHAGLSDEERQQNQNDFVYDRRRIMVATNAFGMGIDKSNVGFVVHYNLPLSLENYYQEAGRAGRDGTRAECLLLYSPSDVRTAEFLVSKSGEGGNLTEEQAQMMRDVAEKRLRTMTFYATTTSCLRAFILRYFGEEAPAYCGNCSNCLTKFEEVDATTGALKVVSCVARLAQRGQRAGAATIVDILRGSKSERILRRHYDTLSTYGIARDISAGQLHQIIDELIYRGVLLRTGGDYPTICLTKGSRAFMRRESPWDSPFVLKIAKEEQARPEAERIAQRSGKSRLASDVSELDDSDQELYSRLARLRTQLAREQNVPSYIIFSNATLVDMCAKRPSSLDELLDVSGVGAKKAERYGEAFLAEINGQAH